MRTVAIPSGRRNAPTQTVCIVDPRTDAYDVGQPEMQRPGLRLQWFATAAEALRFSRTHTTDLWLINTELPGLSGFELCGMLKAQRSDVVVHLVADEYSPEAERRAWAARATLFAVKEGYRTWLQEWLSGQPKPAIASSEPPSPLPSSTSA